MDKTSVIDDLQSVNLPQGYSNAAYDPVDIVKGFWLAIFTGASRYIHADWIEI